MLNRTATIVLALLTAFAPFVAAQPVQAQEATFDPAQMVFPVIGSCDPLLDTFLSPRSGGRTHYATDIMCPEGSPIVAAADGIVKGGWAYPEDQSECCFLYIESGGYVLGYLHILNDTVQGDPAQDDNSFWGIAPGIEPGTEVRQGQLLGWVGDSGNASPYYPHLHFEIKLNGEPINPFPYLLEAPVLDAPIDPAAESGSLVAASSSFEDVVPGSTHAEDIERLVEIGVTRGCSATQYCPTDSITRGQMAAFVYRYLGLDDVEVTEPTFHDIVGHIFEQDIEAVVAAGIGFGVDADHYQPDAPLLREEMAKFLVLAFEIAPGSGELTTFDDVDPDGEFADFIAIIQSVAVTNGCSDTEYCPIDPVTREQMASFFVRSIDLTPTN